MFSLLLAAKWPDNPTQITEISDIEEIQRRSLPVTSLHYSPDMGLSVVGQGGFVSTPSSHQHSQVEWRAQLPPESGCALPAVVSCLPSPSLGRAVAGERDVWNSVLILDFINMLFKPSGLTHLLGRTDGEISPWWTSKRCFFSRCPFLSSSPSIHSELRSELP